MCDHDSLFLLDLEVAWDSVSGVSRTWTVMRTGSYTVTSTDLVCLILQLRYLYQVISGLCYHVEASISSSLRQHQVSSLTMMTMM